MQLIYLSEKGIDIRMDYVWFLRIQLIYVCIKFIVLYCQRFFAMFMFLRLRLYIETSEG